MSSVYDGYIRISKLGDRDEGESTEIYRGYIDGWIARENLKLDRLVEETDVSGSVAVADRRLEELVCRVERGESRGIVTPYLDRFGRDLIEGALALKRITDAGGRLVAPCDGFDSAAPGSSLNFHLRLAIAQDFLDRKKADWDAAKRRAVLEKGIHGSSIPPSGYIKNPDTQLLEIEPYDGPLILRAFQMRAAGTTRGEIADFLNREGCKGSRINPETKEREQINWRSTILYRIFKNRVYLGEARSLPYVKQNAHPALVDVATFEAAQAAARLDKPTGDKHMLKGLIRCQGCRRILTPDSSSNRGKKRIHTYRCRGNHSQGDCKCRAAVSAHVIEPVIENFFWKYAGTKSLEATADNGDLEAAELEASSAEADRRHWQKLNIVAIGETVFAEGLEERIENERVAHARLGELRAQAQHPTLGDVTELRKVWADLEISEKRRLISTVIGTVILRKGHGPIEDRLLIFPRGTEPAGLPRRGRTFPVVAFPFPGELVAAAS